jgi:hypothetical protein
MVYLPSPLSVMVAALAVMQLAKTTVRMDTKNFFMNSYYLLLYSGCKVIKKMR